MIFIFVSTEKYLLDKELKPLLAKYVDESTSSFNFEKLSADDCSASVVVNSCQALPVMADWRVVYVRRIELWGASELEVLSGYFESPNPSTVLILEASKIDNRLKVWKDAVKKNLVKDLKVPTMQELPGWIQQRAKEMGLELESGVGAFLGEHVGVHLGLIEIELQKLSLSIHPAKKISIKHVEEMVGRHLIHTIFEFVEKFSEKNLGASQLLLDEMLLMGETLPGMLALMGRHFRLLMLAKEALYTGAHESALAGLLKIPPFVVKRYVSQCNKMKMSELKAMYGSILIADKKVKSSPLDKRLFLDSLMLNYSVPVIQ